MNIEIANRLHQLRKKHNLSQEDLAAKIGISRQAVSKWERAEASPDTDNIISLAKLYGVSLDELLMTDSFPLNQNSPVSLKKDNYAAAGIKTPAMSISPAGEMALDDGEIYPNRDNSSQSNNSQRNAAFTNNSTNGNDSLFGNGSNPYANNNGENKSSGPDSVEFEKLDEYMSKLGNGLEVGLGKLGNELGKVGKVVGENIDKAGNKIKEEIKKSEEKSRNNSYSNQTESYSESSDNSEYKYNYQYNYEYKDKKHKKERSKTDREKITLSDLVLTMIFVMLFGLTVATIGESSLAFIFAIPTLLTYKIAKQKKRFTLLLLPNISLHDLLRAGYIWRMDI